MAVSIGAPIGFAEVDNSNTVTVTLTADAPYTTSSQRNGLVLVCGSKEDDRDLNSPPQAIVIGDTLVPTITDSATLVRRYNCLSNYSGGNWMPDSTTGPPPNPINGQTTHADWPYYMIGRGAYSWIVLHPLYSGDTITVDFDAAVSAMNPPNGRTDFVWFGCRVHPVENIPDDNWAFSYLSHLAGVNYTHLRSDIFSPTFDTIFWETVCNFEASKFTGLTQFNTFTDDVAGVKPDISVKYELKKTGSTNDGILYYSFYDFTQQYGSSSGWAGDMKIGTSGAEQSMRFGTGMVIGTTDGIPYCHRRTQIYRRL